MPLFSKDNKTILFIHIPKCAGTTIERAFEDAGWDIEFLVEPARKGHRDWSPCNPQHWHYNDLLKNIHSKYDIDYEFTVVRNPFQRLLSELHWRGTATSDLTQAMNTMGLRYLEYYVNNNYAMDNHIRPQQQFIGPTTNVFRFEQIQNVFDMLDRDFGVNQFANHYKTNAYKPETIENLSADFKKLYKEIYFGDHDLLKYNKPFEDSNE